MYLTLYYRVLLVHRLQIRKMAFFFLHCGLAGLVCMHLPTEENSIHGVPQDKEKEVGFFPIGYR